MFCSIESYYSWLRIVFLILIAAGGQPLRAQQFNYNFDSLRHEITRQPEDTTKVRAYLFYASQFFYTDSDSAFYYVSKAKQAAAAYPTSYHYAYALKNEGDLNMIRGNSKAAVKPYRAGISIAKKKKYTLLRIKLMANLGSAYKSLGRLDSAMALLDRVTAAFEGNVETRADSTAYAFHFFQLFDIYRAQGFTREAIEYGEQGYQLSIPLKASRGIGYGFYVLGLKHYQGNPKLGMDYCRRAMQIAVANKIPDLEVFARSLEAAINIKTGHLEAAESALLQYQDYKAPGIQFVTFGRLSKVYYHQKRYPLALKYYLQAMDLAQKLAYRGELLEILETGVNIYQAQKNYKKALETLQKVEQLKTEIASDALKRDYQRWSLKYKLLQKDQLLAQNKLVIAQKDSRLNKQFWFTVVASIITVFFSLIIWLLFRHRQKMHVQRLASLETNQEIKMLEARIDGEEKERSRIAKDLHDGIGGLLSAVKMHFSLLRSEFPELKTAGTFGKGLALLDEASAEVRETAHNLLPDMLHRFGLEEALRIFCKKVSAGQKLQIDFQTVGTIGRFSPSFELAVYRMVQELVNNIIKHAGASQAMVQLSCQDAILSIAVEDQGKGFRKQALGLHTGVGLTSVKSRAKAMGGTFELDTAEGQGTTVYLEFDTTLVSKKMTEVIAG